MKSKLTDHAFNKLYPDYILNRTSMQPVVHCGGSKYRENHVEKKTLKLIHDAILERSRQAFPEAAIQVECHCHLHTAKNVADHFRVRVIDARFNGLDRIARHWLIYEAVSDWMLDRGYALNIIPMNLKEAEQAKDDPLASTLFDIEYATNVFYVDF